MKFGSIALLIVVMMAALAAGQPPKNQSDKTVSADKWLEDLRAANRGKWNEKWFMTGQIRYLSERAVDYLSDRMKQETDSCKLAAANVGHAAAFQNFVKGGFHDMGKGVVLTGKEIAEALSPATTLKGLLEEAVKKGAEWLIKYMQELLAKEKAEVHITHAKRDGCKLVFVSIWDKAASKYDVIIYGDCQCAPLNSFTERGKVKVNNFEIRLSGKANLSLDETNENFVLKADVPSSAKIICDECKPKGTEVAKPTTPVESPGTGPQKTDPPKQPPPAVDPCKVPPPCDACKPIYERVVSICDRLKAIPGEILHLPGEIGSNKNRQNYAKREIAEAEKQGATAKANRAKEELKQLETEAVTLAAKENNLRVEQGKLKTELTTLAVQLKTCETERCGKTATGIAAAETLDACVIGNWVSQTSTDASGAVGYSGIKLTIAADGGATLVYSGMEPAKLTNPVTGQTDSTKTWNGTASGKIAAKNGVVIVQKVDSSALEFIHTVYGRTDRKPSPRLGIVFPPAPYLVKYQCDDRSMKVSVNFFGDIVNGFIFTKK